MGRAHAGSWADVRTGDARIVKERSAEHKTIRKHYFSRAHTDVHHNGNWERISKSEFRFFLHRDAYGCELDAKEI